MSALDPEQGAAELNALSLLEEAVHHVVRTAAGDELLRRTARAVEVELGREGLRRLLSTFVQEFGLGMAVDAAAPEPVSRADGAETDGLAAPDSAAAPELAAPVDDEVAEIALDLVRELLVFWWLRSNPALTRLNGLLDTSGIAATPEFRSAGRRFREVLAKAPGIGAGDENLLDSLEAPLRLVGDSPVAQLRWILPRWRAALGDIEPDLVAGLDLAAEEQAPRFPPGAGPVERPALPLQPAGGEALADRPGSGGGCRLAGGVGGGPLHRGP